MRVLLVDVDCRPEIQNLALDVLSTYHKNLGHDVQLYRHLTRQKVHLNTTFQPDKIALNGTLLDKPDKVYISSVFSWNLGITRLLAQKFSFAEVQVGGSGYDVGVFLNKNPGKTIAQMTTSDWTTLPPGIERLEPDYTLYGFDYAVGFCNRGCNRRCQFCIVPRKEGTIREERYRHPSTWVPDYMKKALLLDNDLALYPLTRQREILSWGREAGVKLSVSQGIDLRAVAREPEIARILAENMPYTTAFDGKMIYGAWDYVQNEGWIRRGIENLLEAGIKPRYMRVYVLVGFDTTLEQDLHRCNVLWQEYKVLPFVMVYNNRKDNPWLRALARWANKPGLIRKMDFWSYDRIPDGPPPMARPEG